MVPGILAEDISGPRVAITYRELTPEIATSEAGRMALDRARRGGGGGSGGGGGGCGGGRR